MQAQLTQVLSNRALNEVRVAWAGYIFTNENLTHWSNHWMAAERPVRSGHQRLAAHPVHRLQHHRQQRVPAAPQPGSLQRAGQLHALVQREGPPRPEGGRRVPAAPRDERQLHQLHGQHRRAQRRHLDACVPGSRTSSRTRSTSTPGTWRPFRRSCAPTASACTRVAATTSTCRTTRRRCRTTGR